MKGFKGSSGVTCLLWGALIQLKIENLFLPHCHSSEKEPLAQGRYSSRITLSFHSDSGLGVTVIFSFTHACKSDRPSCQQALPFGASGSQRKLSGGCKLFAAALAFCAPKWARGSVTSEIADGWSHLIPAICGMTVLGAMLFIIAVLLSLIFLVLGVVHVPQASIYKCTE